MGEYEGMKYCQVVCASGKSTASSFCPLSPTIDLGLGVDSTVGERVGVRGPSRSLKPPHPSPLPRNTHKAKDTSIAGRGGRKCVGHLANMILE